MKKMFTLLELLIVIAIIGILATILLPSLSKAREVSKTAVCLSQVKQLTMAYLIYSGENNNKTIGKFPTFPDKTNMWMGMIYPYHNSPDVMKCPSATHLSQDTAAQNVWGSAKTGWAGDSGWWTYGGFKGRGSYALNSWTWSSNKDGIATNDNYFHNLAQVDTPTNTPLFFDSNWVDTLPNRNQDPVSSDGSQRNSIGRIYIDRHYQKKVNYGLIDGSARTFKLSELYHLDWNNDFLHRDLPLL